MLVTQLFPTLCDSMDCTLPGSFVHGILQARILKWVAIPSPRLSFQPKDWRWVSCTADRCFTTWATSRAFQIVGASYKSGKPKLLCTSALILSCVHLGVGAFLQQSFSYSFSVVCVNATCLAVCSHTVIGAKYLLLDSPHTFVFFFWSPNSHLPDKCK